MTNKNLFDEDSDSSHIYLRASADFERTDKPTKQRNVLVIEDDLADFKILKQYLDRATGVEFKLECVTRLADGLDRVARGGIHIVLLDLGLPDSCGLETFQQLHFHAPGVPVIVLTGLEDESVALQALGEGALDYLVKGTLDTDSLSRSIDYARARHNSQVKLTRALQSVQASEERFRSISESANDAIILSDSTRSIIAWNPAAQAIFGYSKNEVLGKGLATLMPERYRETHDKAFQQYQETGEAQNIGKTIELDGLRKDGSEFPLELSLSTWKAAEGQFYCGIIRDITDRKRAEEERIRRLQAEREISIASKVQKGLFPTQAPSLDGFDIAGAVFPADKASGDYYDFIPMADETVGVVVGDVSGHGLGPAMLMVQTQAYLRALAREYDDPSEILTRTNQLLFPNGHGHFVSLFFGRIDPRARSLIFTSAGHPGYLLKPSGEVTILDGTGTVLGVLDDACLPCGPAIALESGDVILLPTDGIQETQSPDQEMFGIERTLEVVHANRDESASEVIQWLYQAACDWSHGRPQADDMTAVVIKIQTLTSERRYGDTYWQLLDLANRRD